MSASKQGDGSQGAVSERQDIEHDYRNWLACRRAQAEARGGKAWSKSQLAGAGEECRRGRIEHRLYVEDRKPGEIVNARTGEVVTGCLNIGKIAELLGVSTIGLTDEMERLGLVQRVLDCKEVPMICQPAARKPVYFHTPEATPYGVEAGLVIPIEVYREGTLRGLLLVTPRGQEHLGGVGRKKTDAAIKLEGKLNVVADLFRQGHTQADIARITRLPRQTVSRHVARLRASA